MASFVRDPRARQEPGAVESAFVLLWAGAARSMESDGEILGGHGIVIVGARRSITSVWVLSHADDQWTKSSTNDGGRHGDVCVGGGLYLVGAALVQIEDDSCSPPMDTSAIGWWWTLLMRCR